MRAAADIQVYGASIRYQLRFVAHYRTGFHRFALLLCHLDLQSLAFQKGNCRFLVQLCDSKLIKVDLVASVADDNINLSAL